MTPEEYEAKRAERRAATDEARKAQLSADLDALIAIEEQYGEGRTVRLDLAGFVEGLPTMIVLRCPTPAEYKRFRDTFRAAKDGNLVARGQSADLLGKACLAYPSADVYQKILEKFPSVQDSVATAAVKLGDAKAEEQGKG